MTDRKGQWASKQ